MKDWFDTALVVDDVSLEIGFLLFSDFYYGPDRHQDIVARKKIEPLRIPTFSRTREKLVTTREAESHTKELALYYADVLRVAEKHGKSYDQIRQYFWLRLFISNSAGNFSLSFPWYDTLSEMEELLNSLANPPDSGEVYWDRDQCWELEIDSHDGMLYVREWDPDYEEVHSIGKFPNHGLAECSKATLNRAKRVISELASELTEDYWTKY